MRRAVVALGWAALVIGWWLVWRGAGAWGCGFIALFALIRLATARPRDMAEVTAGPLVPIIPTVPVQPSGPPASPPAMDEPPEDPLLLLAGRGLLGKLPRDPHSNHIARWRRLAWVSYGNAFLQGAIDMDDWHRHSLLWPAVCTFRDGVNRQLIAQDGFAWLNALRQGGALRLTLDVDDSVPSLGGIQGWDTQAVTCHFADRRERWRLGQEMSAAERAAQALDDGAQRSAAYPLLGRGGYQPEIDAYWRVAQWDDVEAPVAVDWRAVAADVRRTLKDVRFLDEGKLSVPGPGWFFQGDESAEDWARFPVLPPDPALQVPHRLLSELAYRRARFDNDSHCKNEGNYWARLQGDDAALAQVDAYGELLLALTGYVQRLAGSETRWRPRDLPRP